MSLFDLREKVIADYLSDPENQRSLATFAATAEGKNLVRSFMTHAEGRQFIRQLVPLLLEHLNLPEETRQTVLKSLPGD